jgi:BRCT domain type II-containing protein
MTKLRNRRPDFSDAASHELRAVHLIEVDGSRIFAALGTPCASLTPH